jgi:hypothetical protein
MKQWRWNVPNKEALRHHLAPAVWICREPCHWLNLGHSVLVIAVVLDAVAKDIYVESYPV